MRNIKLEELDELQTEIIVIRRSVVMISVTLIGVLLLFLILISHISIQN